MDLPKVQDLKELTAFCRKTGILALKYGGFEITLSQQALFPESNYKKKTEEQESSITKELTEEQILLWSVSGMGGGVT